MKLLNSHPPISSQEREFFDHIAKKHIEKDLYRVSCNARKRRLLQTLRHLEINPGIDVLEIGCGAGFAPGYLSGNFRTYTGLDYSQELIRYALANHKRSNVNFYARDFCLCDVDGHYDLIFMIGVLHHMLDIPLVIKKSFSLLKTGGYLAINEPQPANVLFHYLRKIRAKIDPSYSNEQKELERTQIITLFQQAGFTEIQSFQQGFFSTPFAEIVMKPQFLASPLSFFACKLDSAFEMYPVPLLKKLSWNIVVTGRKNP